MSTVTTKRKTSGAIRTYLYACRECKRRHAERVAQCSSCRAWDTLDVIAPTKQQADPGAGVVSMAQAVKMPAARRVPTGLAWFDKMAGGGLVRGQRVLFGGAEGAGKTTLLLQLCHAWAGRGKRPLFVSGEMDARQLQESAQRIGAVHGQLYLTEQVDVVALGEKVCSGKYGVLVVDSLNVLADPDVKGDAGDNAQLKACLTRLGRLCRDYGVPSVFLCHLNGKDAISGPRWARHEVDAVLSLTKETTGGRELRITKNRAGPEGTRRLTMTEKGLKP